MNIKTVTTTTGMNTVVFGNSANMYYWVKNIGSTDITVGATNNAENHAIVKPDNGICVDTFTNTVYINGAGTVEIYECNTPICPFKKAQRGGDITAKGNPVQLDGLQGGVPFSEMVVSGKNLMPRKSFESTEINGITFTLNNDGSITAVGNCTNNIFFDFTGKFTIPDGIYYLSGTPSEYLGSDCYLSIRSGTPPIGQKTNFDELDGSMSVISHDDAYCIIRINAGVSFGDGVVFRPQLELGDTATEYEPPITGQEVTLDANGTEYTITPDSNPYTVPNDIRQLDGLNNISVSEGEISVVGVRKNAAIKRIWEKLDELTTAIIVSNGESE